MVSAWPGSAGVVAEDAQRGGVSTIFQEIIMTYPQVLAYLGELSASRSRLQQAEDILDLHIDLI